MEIKIKEIIIYNMKNFFCITFFGLFIFPVFSQQTVEKLLEGYFKNSLEIHNLSAEMDEEIIQAEKTLLQTGLSIKVSTGTIQITAGDETEISLSTNASLQIPQADNLSFSAKSNIEIYHTQAQISINEEATTYSGSGDRSNVQGRGYAPTIGERKMVANNILNWSKANYGTENYNHDKWLYLGLGGYYVSRGFLGWNEVDGSNATVGTNLNNWINLKVSEMGTIPSGQTAPVPYYPVGIVLMNFVNNHSTTVKNILTLNNKYRLQFDPNKPSDYNPGAKAKSAAPSYSSGMNDSDVAAFGWD